MFRIYDYEKSGWMGENCAISPTGKLVVWEKRGIFGRTVVKEYNSAEYDYIVDMDTGLRSRDDIVIFENDIIKVGNVTGVVGWNSNASDYVLFDYKNKKFYDLWNDLTAKEATIIGDIETTPELLPLNDDEKSEWEEGAIVKEIQ